MSITLPDRTGNGTNKNAHHEDTKNTKTHEENTISVNAILMRIPKKESPLNFFVPLRELRVFVVRIATFLWAFTAGFTRVGRGLADHWARVDL